MQVSGRPCFGLRTFLLHHSMARRAPLTKGTPGWEAPWLCSLRHPLRPTHAQCYLSRPSGLTAPSSDLGSGLKELQAVWLQVCMTGQAVGPVAQTSMAVHMLPTSESSQRSSAAPVEAAFLRACSTWAGLTGRLRTGFRLWKLCSM